MSRIPLVALLASLSVAHASPITINFSGSVTQVSIDDLYGDIVPGALIQGNFTYESTAPDLVPADPTIGSYTSVGLPYGMTVTVAGHVFNGLDSLNLGIFNGAVDQYTVTAFGGGVSLTLELFFQDNSGTVFSSDALPLAAPPPALMTILDFRLHEIGDLGETQVEGIITDLSPTSDIPEPATALMLVAGLSALASLRRRI